MTSKRATAEEQLVEYRQMLESTKASYEQKISSLHKDNLQMESEFAEVCIDWHYVVFIMFYTIYISHIKAFADTQYVFKYNFLSPSAVSKKNCSILCIIYSSIYIYTINLYTSLYMVTIKA